VACAPIPTSSDSKDAPPLRPSPVGSHHSSLPSSLVGILRRSSWWGCPRPSLSPRLVGLHATLHASVDGATLSLLKDRLGDQRGGE
jgi:hypothetical protein